MEWHRLITGQLEFYWDVHLRPRLDGLTDDEYFWAPVKDAWTVRHVDGLWRMDGGWPVPEPTPVTTIAWRLMHIAATGLVNRASAFFGDDPHGDADMNDPIRVPADLPGTAAEAIAFTERAYAAWMDGLTALDDKGMAQRLGPKGGHYADDSMAQLALHINREIMHHGGEIGLLRDLYSRR